MTQTAATPLSASDAAHCPVCGDPGPPVKWITVQSLTTGPVPGRQVFRVCMGAGCDVVYFGDAGAVVHVGDLRVAPGFKNLGPSALLCYCFPLSRGELARKAGTGGASDIIARIASEVRAGNCACDVRNPTGRCCLSDLRRESASHGEECLAHE